MHFSTRLKAIIDSGNLKMKDLSNYLNYDLSYISKWVNGKCLPSSKTAEEIFYRMSKYFAEKLYLTDAQDKILNIADIGFPVDRLDMFEELIESVLADGYYYSLSFEEDMGFNSETVIRVNGKSEEIVNDVAKEIKKYIAITEEDMEIICSVGNLKFFIDLLKEFNSSLWARKNSVKFKIILSHSAYTDISKDKIALVQLLISKIMFFDFEAVISDISRFSGYVYVKNRGFMDIRLNTLGQPLSMVHNENSKCFHEFNKIVDSEINGKKVIMKSRKEYKIGDEILDYMIFINC